MLELVYNAAPSTRTAEPGLAVVVGDQCREAIRPLELGEPSSEALSAIPWAHETLEAAYHYLRTEAAG